MKKKTETETEYKRTMSEELLQVRSAKRVDSFNVYEPVKVLKVVERTLVLITNYLAPIEFERRALKHQMVIGFLFFVTEATVFRGEVLPVGKMFVQQAVACDHFYQNFKVFPPPVER